MPKKIRKRTSTPPPSQAIKSSKISSTHERISESTSSSTDEIIRIENSQDLRTSSIPFNSNPSNRLSAWFDNIQKKTPSRSPSPDLETTPRPLRVLKSRKSLLILGGSPRSITPTPQKFRRKSMVQSPEGQTRGEGNSIGLQPSPPTKSFLGLRLLSPKPRVQSPRNFPVSTTNLPSIETQLAEPRSSEVRFSVDPTLKVQQSELSRQMTKSSASTATSSNSFLALSNFSQLINWKQRSLSDGSTTNIRSVLVDKGPSRAVQVIHPSIIYKSMRHVESELSSPVQSVLRPKKLRRASSAEPGYLSLGVEPGVSASSNSARPLTPRPPTLSNIDSKNTRLEMTGRTGVFSKVLCSIQDMSPQVLSNSRPPPETKLDDTPTKRGTVKSIPKSPAEPLLSSGGTKGKGALRARGTLGSIRKRFGSGSVKSLKMNVEGNQTVVPTAQPSRKKEWITPFILKAQLDIHSESIREHVNGGKEFWVCIEVEGKVSNFQRVHATTLCEDELGGLDIAMILDLSAYASPTTFQETKSMAKHLINSLSPIDRVSITAFTSIQSFPGVEAKYPLSQLTSTNRQQLFGFIDGLFGQAERQGTIRRDIKAIIMAVINDLKGSTCYETFNESGRTSHAFLLTSSLRQGDLPNDTFDALNSNVKIHILGVGPLVTLKERPWKGGWLLNLGPLPTNETPKEVGLEGQNNLHCRIPTLPRLLDSLRCAANFGELTNIRIEMNSCDGCRILEVLGDTTFERLVPGEKRTVFVKLAIATYNPASAAGSSMNTPEKNKEWTGSTSQRTSLSPDGSMRVQGNLQQPVIPEYKLLERQLAATLGEIETRALAVSIIYEHEFFGSETVIITKKFLKIQRYDGDGNWSIGKNITSSNSYGADDESFTSSTDLLIQPSGINQNGSFNENAEYVRTMLAKKIAEMTIGQAEENPRKALRVVEECGIRGKGVYSVASELEWRIKIQEEEERTESALKSLADELSKSNTTVPTIPLEVEPGDLVVEEAIIPLDSSYTKELESRNSLRAPRNSPEIKSFEYSDGWKTEGVTETTSTRLRHSSIVIHPIIAAACNSPPDSESNEANNSDHDDLYSPPSEIQSKFQNDQPQDEHVDEAGRIWKELAETKMGLRRDVRPGRYRSRTPTFTFKPRHTRHNSIDLLKDRQKSTGDMAMDWIMLTPSRVKDKQKERKRRMKKQAIKRRSMTGDRGLNIGRPTSEEAGSSSDLHFDSGRNEGKNYIAKGGFSQLFQTNKDGGYVFNQDKQDTLSAVVASRGVNIDNQVAGNEQSNRDTLKSLITLRDVKETDFSPWAC